jgi:type II secretory pathway pseudopilin PulG
MSITRRCADEAGFSIVEVLMAIALITAAMIPLMTSLAGARRSSLASLRVAAATHEAQYQIELMRVQYRDDYAHLALSTTPGYLSDVANPDNRLTGTAGSPLLYEEPVATGGTVAHGPDDVTRDSIQLRVHRYVTWRAETCQSCAGAPVYSEFAKRITVAVVPVTQGGTGDHTPKAVWLSTVKVGS